MSEAVEELSDKVIKWMGISIEIDNSELRERADNMGEMRSIESDLVSTTEHLFPWL